MNADKIVVLANGKLVKEGTHEQLLTLGAAYYPLWEQLIPDTVPISQVPTHEKLPALC
jgi:ABC-type glutathione transport system ATPase component